MKRKKRKRGPDKKLPKMPLSLYCVCHVLQGMGPEVKTVCIPSKTALEKINFSAVSSYQLKIASGFGMWACVYFCIQL